MVNAAVGFCKRSVSDDGVVMGGLASEGVGGGGTVSCVPCLASVLPYGKARCAVAAKARQAKGSQVRYVRIGETCGVDAALVALTVWSCRPDVNTVDLPRLMGGKEGMKQLECQ